MRNRLSKIVIGSIILTVFHFSNYVFGTSFHEKTAKFEQETFLSQKDTSAKVKIREAYESNFQGFENYLNINEEDYIKGKFYVKFKQISLFNFVENSDLFSVNPELRTFADRHKVNNANVKRMFKALTELNNPKINGHSNKLKNIFTIQCNSNSSPEEIIKDLSALPYVVYAERVPEVESFYTPNDPQYIQQWHLNQVNSSFAWNIYNANSNNAEVVIAIVDDAVKIDHQDLTENIWTNPGEIPNNNIDDDSNGFIDDINGYDLANFDNNPNPPINATNSFFMHGTHVAGIAGATSNNNTGIASIAGAGQNNVKIMAVKTKTDQSTGSSLQAAYEGVAYAIAAGADVINMSWGGYGYSQTNQSLMTVAHYLGIKLIAAAGNDGLTTPAYPASYNYVISVGATNSSDIKATFSNYGPTIDIMAPGVLILSTVPVNNNSYAILNGTSMASPLVASAVALISSYAPELQPYQIELLLENNSFDIYPLNSLSYAGNLGSGRIDLLQIFLMLQSNAITSNVDFSSNFQTIVIGHPATFAAKAESGTLSDYQWSFPNSLSSTSTFSNPAVIYLQTGYYDVSLTVTNQTQTQTNSATVSKSSYIHVITEAEYQNLSGKENNHWYFKKDGVLSFDNNSGTFTTTQGSVDLHNGYYGEGTSSISNFDGNLLLYTNGSKVWNRHHTINPSLFFMGGESAAQGSLMLPQPSKFVNGYNQNHGKYFVFNVDDCYANNGLGTSYTIIDMNLNGGLGAVDPNFENIELNSIAAEKMIAVLHGNGKDFWIISHSMIGNTFLVYLLDENGVDTNSQAINIGGYQSNNFGLFSLGALAISPDGSKLAQTVYEAGVELFDFDDTSGSITNYTLVPNTIFVKTKRGLEFSPNGEFLYYCYNGFIKQIDLMNSLSMSIANVYVSTFIMDTPLEMGPNEKIYTVDKADNLIEISSPNSFGSACNIQIYPLPSTNVHSLNNKVPYSSFRISGYVANSQDVGVIDVEIMHDSLTLAMTDSLGYYEFDKMKGWSGIIEPFKQDYLFIPNQRIYSNLDENKINQDYLAIHTPSASLFLITGIVTIGSSTGAGLGGVSITASGYNTATTYADGTYYIAIPSGWTGTLSASYQTSGQNYTFDGPISITTPLSGNISNQDFIAYTGSCNITGTVLDTNGIPITNATVNGFFVDNNGYYSISVACGSNISISPQAIGYTFSPDTIAFSLILSNQTQDFIGLPMPDVIISGTVLDNFGNPIPNASLLGQTLDTNGNYSISCIYGDNLNIVPQAVGYIFNPFAMILTNVTSNQTYDFTGTIQSYSISGIVMDNNGFPIPNAIVNYSVNGIAYSNSVFANGNYLITVGYGDNIIILPQAIGYAFVPSAAVFNNVTSNQTQSFTALAQFPILVQGTAKDSNNVPITNAVINNQPVDTAGGYSEFVNFGDNIILLPYALGFSFSPPFVTFTNVTSSITQDFTGNPVPIMDISGEVIDTIGNPLANAMVSGNPVDSNGNYLIQVNYGSTATFDPFMLGYEFTPSFVTLTNIINNQIQNFIGAPIPIIEVSGSVTDISGLPLTNVEINGQTVDSNGNYLIQVNYGNNLDVIPFLSGYYFTPASASYTNLTSNQVQDFVGIVQTYLITGTLIDDYGNLITNATVNGQTVTNTGNFSISVFVGNNITVIPHCIGYSFYPDSVTFLNVTSNHDQFFVGTPQLSNIVTAAVLDTSGNPIPNSSVNGQFVDINGNYSVSVEYGDNITLTPLAIGFSFVPPVSSLINVTSNQTITFLGTSQASCVISGSVLDLAGDPVPNASINGQSVDSNGYYTISVDFADTITLIPQAVAYYFNPEYSVHNYVNSDIIQNFEGIEMPGIYVSIMGDNNANGMIDTLETLFTDSSFAVISSIGFAQTIHDGISFIDLPYMQSGDVSIHLNMPDSVASINYSQGEGSLLSWQQSYLLSEDSLGELIPETNPISYSTGETINLICGVHLAQEIVLKQGWNIFSINIMPENSNILELVNEIQNWVTIVKDSDGEICWPLYNINNIGNVSLAEGYQIKLTSQKTLSVQSFPHLQTIIDLDAGWSFIGFPAKEDKEMELILNPVVSNIILVKNELGMVYWPQFSLNYIGLMKPGEGYQIKMSNQGSITVDFEE